MPNCLVSNKRCWGGLFFLAVPQGLACKIFVPQSRIEPVPNPNHWTTRKFEMLTYLVFYFVLCTTVFFSRFVLVSVFCVRGLPWITGDSMKKEGGGEEKGGLVDYWVSLYSYQVETQTFKWETLPFKYQYLYVFSLRPDISREINPPICLGHKTSCEPSEKDVKSLICSLNK